MLELAIMCLVKGFCQVNELILVELAVPTKTLVHVDFVDFSGIGRASVGAPRIHGELQMLGIRVSESTVAKYMIRHWKPPSQTWRTFLDNHLADLISVAFFTVPTATFRVAASW